MLYPPASVWKALTSRLNFTSSQYYNATNIVVSSTQIRYAHAKSSFALPEAQDCSSICPLKCINCNDYHTPKSKTCRSSKKLVKSKEEATECLKPQVYSFFRSTYPNNLNFSIFLESFPKLPPPTSQQTIKWQNAEPAVSVPTKKIMNAEITISPSNIKSSNPETAIHHRQSFFR